MGLITKIDPSDDLTQSSERIDYPLAGSNCGYGGSGNTGCSKHFKTRFEEIEGFERPITIVAVHFIAYPYTSDRCAKREAQATVISHFLEDVVDTDDIIIAGDYNGYPCLPHKKTTQKGVILFARWTHNAPD